MEALHSPMHPSLLLLLGVIATIALAALFFGFVGTALRDIGLSPASATIIIVSSLLGSYVNIPIARIPAKHHEVTEEYVRVFGIPYRVPRVTTEVGTTILAINVGGALIPSLLAFYVLYRYISVLPQAVLGIFIVAIIAHLVAKPTRGVGIVTPAFVPPIVAALAAFLIPSDAPYAIAYVSGVLGTLIGADLANLPAIPSIGAKIASIGGAGTFDGVFLSGIIAVLLA